LIDWSNRNGEAFIPWFNVLRRMSVMIVIFILLAPQKWSMIDGVPLHLICVRILYCVLNCIAFIIINHRIHSLCIWFTIFILRIVFIFLWRNAIKWRYHIGIVIANIPFDTDRRIDRVIYHPIVPYALWHVLAACHSYILWGYVCMMVWYRDVLDECSLDNHGCRMPTYTGIILLSSFRFTNLFGV